MSYPLDRTGRIAERAKAREQYVKRAERLAARHHGLSLACEVGDAPLAGGHARYGCTDDGSGCLCACHDPGGET